MINKVTTYKLKCLCGKTIQGATLEKLEQQWENHIFDNKCRYEDNKKLNKFEENFYKEWRKAKKEEK